MLSPNWSEIAWHMFATQSSLMSITSAVRLAPHCRWGRIKRESMHTQQPNAISCPHFRSKYMQVSSTANICFFWPGWREWQLATSDWQRECGRHSNSPIGGSICPFCGPWWWLLGPKTCMTIPSYHRLTETAYFVWICVTSDFLTHALAALVRHQVTATSRADVQWSKGKQNQQKLIASN